MHWNFLIFFPQQKRKKQTYGLATYWSGTAQQTKVWKQAAWRWWMWGLGLPTAVVQTPLPNRAKFVVKLRQPHYPAGCRYGKGTQLFLLWWRYFMKEGFYHDCAEQVWALLPRGDANMRYLYKRRAKQRSGEERSSTWCRSELANYWQRRWSS